MALFGKAIPQNIKRHGSKSIVNYSGSSPSRHGSSQRTVSTRARATHDFDDIILESKYEAEDVLDKMVDAIDRYEQCTVGDLYDLIGETPNFADQNYGWTNLASASVRRDRQGYVLVLPRTGVL